MYMCLSAFVHVIPVLKRCLALACMSWDPDTDPTFGCILSQTFYRIWCTFRDLVMLQGYVTKGVSFKIKGKEIHRDLNLFWSLLL